SKWKKVDEAIGYLVEKPSIAKLYTEVDEIISKAAADIKSKDTDGVITFTPKEFAAKATKLKNKFNTMQDFSNEVGNVVHATIDEPFHEKIDHYIQSMRDLTITQFNTVNRLGITESSMGRVNVKEAITIDDLLTGKTVYAKQLQKEYEKWQLANQDQKISADDYRQAALHTRAFEYTSIKDEQQKKEFWFAIIAIVVTIGLGIICPPAGVVAGGLFAAYEIGSAVTGIDLVSERELGDAERWLRGGTAIIPLSVVGKVGKVATGTSRNVKNVAGQAKK
ncbi:MAG: pre-toxin TG domain-containing protein, partial [Lysinibacillus sp.]